MGNKTGPELKRCFEVLGLEPGASRKEAKRAYRKLVRLWHPDRFFHDPHLKAKADEKLKEINLAYGGVKTFLSTRQEVVKKRPSWGKEPTDAGVGGPSGRDMVIRPEGGLFSDWWRSVVRTMEAFFSTQTPSPGSSPGAGGEGRDPPQGRPINRLPRMPKRKKRRPAPGRYPTGYIVRTRGNRRRVGAVGRVEPIERIRPVSRISRIGGDE